MFHLARAGPRLQRGHPHVGQPARWSRPPQRDPHVAANFPVLAHLRAASHDHHDVLHAERRPRQSPAAAARPQPAEHAHVHPLHPRAGWRCVLCVLFK